MPLALIQSVHTPIPEHPQKRRDYCLLFKQELTQDVDLINHQITRYNQTNAFEDRLQQLNDLEHFVHQIDRKYPDDIKSFFPDYHEKIHKQLFDSMQREARLLNPNDRTMQLSFPAYLKTLPSEKTDQLLRLLLEPSLTTEKLTTLFAVDEPGREEFLSILSNYELEVLSGHNSKNFKLLDKNTQELLVLKIDNRMGVPKDAIDHLRSHSMKEVFTPDDSEREAMCFDPSSTEQKYITRTLLITTFHPAGDLQKESQRLHTDDAIDSNKIAEYGLRRALEMALIIQQIEQDDCCFTDMKNNNWLVDDTGKLRISDKKGFLFTYKINVVEEDLYGNEIKTTKTILDLNHVKNRYYAHAHSKQVSPPELDRLATNQPAIDVSKMHAYMLGKNLYQYLTNTKNNELIDFKSISDYRLLHGNDLQYDNDVFLTERSKQIGLARTVALLMEESIERRPNLTDSIDVLASALYPELGFDSNDDNHALWRAKLGLFLELDRLDHYQVSPNDPILMAFISKEKTRIQNAQHQTELMQTSLELKGIQYLLQENNEQWITIKRIIHDFKQNDEPEIVAKGMRIETALLNVPFMERASIADGKTPAQRAVLKEMASNPPNAMGASFLNQNKKRHFDSTAFNEFKEKFKKTAHRQPDNPNASLDSTSRSSVK